MKLLGSRILNQKYVIATRRVGWYRAFDVDAEYELSIAPKSDDEIAATLSARYRLQALEMQPLRWEGGDFQLAHQDRMGRTETFYSFSREVHYTGSVTLWKQRPFASYIAPVTARLSKDGQLFVEGYCTGPERLIIDDVLRDEVGRLAHAVKWLAPMVDEYNTGLESASSNWVTRNRSQLAEWRAKGEALRI